MLSWKSCVEEEKDGEKSNRKANAAINKQTQLTFNEANSR